MLAADVRHGKWLAKVLMQAWVRPVEDVAQFIFLSMPGDLCV